MTHHPSNLHPTNSLNNEVLVYCHRWSMTIHLITSSCRFMGVILWDPLRNRARRPPPEGHPPPWWMYRWWLDPDKRPTCSTLPIEILDKRCKCNRKGNCGPLQLFHWSEAWLWWCASLLAKTSPRRIPYRRQIFFAKSRKHQWKHFCWI